MAEQIISHQNLYFSQESILIAGERAEIITQINSSHNRNKAIKVFFGNDNDSLYLIDHQIGFVEGNGSRLFGLLKRPRRNNVD